MRVRSALLVPVLGLALVGCSDDPAPVPPPPAPSSAAAPTLEPLEVPASATPATPQGAANFARYYLEVLERAQLSGDVESLKALSHPACGTCNNIIKASEAGTNTTVRGGAYTVLSAEATADGADAAVVDLFYAREAFELVDSSGARVGGQAAVERDFALMRCERRADSWWVRAISFPEVR